MKEYANRSYADATGYRRGRLPLPERSRRIGFRRAWQKRILDAAMKAALIAVMLGVAAPALAAPPPSKCDFKRGVALGKFTLSFYKAWLKEGSVPIAIVDKLQLNWVKAAKKGDCTPEFFPPELGECELQDLGNILFFDMIEAVAGQGPTCTAP